MSITTTVRNESDGMTFVYGSVFLKILYRSVYFKVSIACVQSMEISQVAQSVQWQGYGLNDREIRVRFPEQCRFFSTSKLALGTYPTSCPMATGSCLPCPKLPDHDANHSPPSSARERLELYLHKRGQGPHEQHWQLFAFYRLWSWIFKVSEEVVILWRGELPGNWSCRVQTSAVLSVWRFYCHREVQSATKQTTHHNAVTRFSFTIERRMKSSQSVLITLQSFWLNQEGWDGWSTAALTAQNKKCI
jgi:hypothetical protein